MKSEWEKRKCKVVSLVIDKVERIAEWKKDLEELAQGKIEQIKQITKKKNSSYFLYLCNFFKILK